MKLLRISPIQATTLSNDVNQVFTPGYLTVEDNYYFYKEVYTSAELLDTTELTFTQLDGLTPIDPTKPMFPKKK